MKLSDYAKKVGVSYQTAWRWWQKGHLISFRYKHALNKGLKPLAPQGEIVANI